MKENQKKLDSLEKALLALDARQLSDERKNVVKNAVFKRCNFDLIDRLSLLDAAELNALSRVSVKERVFDMINGGVNVVFWSFRRLAKFSASFAVFMFVFFAIFNFMTVDQDIVFANKPSIFTKVVGNVVVERNGKTLHVENGMYAAEGDRIITNGGGVTIRFFDDTESRLGNSSEVVIDKLYTNELNDVITEIEISVVTGMVWSNVVNLVGDSVFKVTTDDVEAVVDSKASFNVNVDHEYASVEVYDDVVRVNSSDFNGHVVKGNVVAVEDGRSTEIADVDTDWIAVNLHEDIVHKDSIDKAVLSDKLTVVSVVDEMGEKDQNIEDSQDIKSNFDFAEKEFVIADVKLNVDKSEEEVVEAKIAMSKFHTLVEEIYDDIDDVREKDEELADEMEEYVDGRLDVLEKSVALSEPGTPEYLGVEVLNDLKIVGADDDELADVKIKIGLAKLSDVDDVLKSGDVELATEVLNDSVVMIDEASELMNDDVVSDYLVALDLAQEFENEIDEIEEIQDMEIPYVDASVVDLQL